jgi:hypothetical protein
MAFAFNPRRDAWSTMAGFVLQVDITILRWLDLQQNEVLELERGVDLDLVQSPSWLSASTGRGLEMRYQL